MIEQTVHYNGATLTAKRGTVRDRIQLGAIARKLDIEDGDDFNSLASITFARFLTRVVVDGDIGIELPAATDSEEMLRAGLDRFLDADEGLYDAVVEVLNASDEPLGEPETQPDAKKKD